MTGCYNNLAVFKSLFPFGIYQFNQLLFLYKTSLLKLANAFFFLWCLLLKCLITHETGKALCFLLLCLLIFYQQSCHKIIKVAFHHHNKFRVCFCWSFMDIFVLLNPIPVIHDINFVVMYKFGLWFNLQYLYKYCT